MIYVVTFEVHKNCQIHSFVYHCEAKNAKEACAIAKQAWQDEERKEHMFHIHAVRSKRQAPGLLNVKTRASTTVQGEEVMNRFISTDLRTWRVSGRNLYGW